MNELDLVAAIQYLKPNAQFSFQKADYSTIKWDVLEGEAPTQNELDAAFEHVKADKIQAEIDNVSKKAAAEAKLAALGLTTDDLKALGLN